MSICLPAERLVGGLMNCEWVIISMFLVQAHQMERVSLFVIFCKHTWFSEKNYQWFIC